MIYVNGDSWSQPSNYPWEDYSWPKLLEKKIAHPVINHSAGCGSNNRMLSGLQNFYIQGHRPNLVIIALSTFGRFSIPGDRMSNWTIGYSGWGHNDRSGKHIKQTIDWWNDELYDELAFVYNNYKIIWQIHEFCNQYMNCPVIFFNAYDQKFFEFQKEIFGSETELTNWVNSRVLDQLDFSTFEYIDGFKFFKNQSKNWVIDNTCWHDMLSTKLIDDKTGRHPGHPSPQGHKLISDYVFKNIENLIKF